MPHRIAFDIGGVLSRHPKIFRSLYDACEESPLWEVYVLTDMPRDRATELLALNGYRVADERLLCADWSTHQEQCKAVEAESALIDVLVDDHLGYIISDQIPVGLLVVPRPKKQYNDPSWRTRTEDAVQLSFL